MGYSDAIRTFVLKCGHTVAFKNPWPNVGKSVMCVRCGTGSVVTKRIREFIVDCDECKYRRGFGMDLDTCRRRAVGHARIYAHDVTIYQGEEVLDAVTGRQQAVIDLILP